MEIILIAAVAKNNVIGNKGKIPWKIPEDIKRFKRLTLGHPVIMGRRTYESIPEKYRPLSERTNIILSKTMGFEDNTGIIVCRDMAEAIREARHRDKKCYIAGGQQVYEQTIDLASRLEITEVHEEFNGDAFFPSIDRNRWKITFRENHEDYSFVTYELRHQKLF